MADDDPTGGGDNTIEARQFIADLTGCIGFFSRLPLPGSDAHEGVAEMPDFNRAARALWLAGVVIALPGAAVLMLLGATALPDGLVAILALAVLIATTGALHEDGLADTVDGFGGGSTRERKLDIMRDSRLGTYGTLALILATGLRIAALAAILARTGPVGAAVLFLVGAAVSRTALIWIWHALPPQRPDGASAAAGQPGDRALHLNLAAVAILIVAVVPQNAGWCAAILAGALPLAGAAALSRLARRQIGGQTGDVLGAGQQIGELAFYIAVLICA